MSLTPELILKHTLAQAVATMRTSPDIIRGLFPDLDSLNPDLIDRTTAYLKRNDRLPVLLNYPKPDMILPAVYLVTHRSPENVKYDVLGDGMGFECFGATQEHYLDGYPDPDNPNVNVIANSLRVGWNDSPTYRIFVLTEDDEITNVFCEALRYFMYIAKMQLETVYGMADMTTETLDFNMELKWLPPRVYTRVLLLKFSAVQRSLDGGVFNNTAYDTEYWHNVSPILNRFVLAVVNQGDVAILEPTGITEIL